MSRDTGPSLQNGHLPQDLAFGRKDLPPGLHHPKMPSVTPLRDYDDAEDDRDVNASEVVSVDRARGLSGQSPLDRRIAAMVRLVVTRSATEENVLRCADADAQRFVDAIQNVRVFVVSVPHSLIVQLLGSP